MEIKKVYVIEYCEVGEYDTRNCPLYENMRNPDAPEDQIMIFKNKSEAEEECSKMNKPFHDDIYYVREVKYVVIDGEAFLCSGNESKFNLGDYKINIYNSQVYYY